MAGNQDGAMTFLHRQLFQRIPKLPAVDLSGKKYIITGANSGIGFILSKQIATRGGKVVMAVRSMEKGETARQEILKEHANAAIEVRHCDLDSFASVRSFVDGLSSDKDDTKIHAVVLNAALLAQSWQTSEAGYERSIQVNVLSNALLAVLVVPLLMRQSSAEGYIPRIVMVSSEVHRFTPFKERKEQNLLEAFSDPAKYDVQDRYYSSKLMNLMWTLQLAKKVDPSKIKIVLAAPGFSRTNLLREVKQRFIVAILETVIARSAEEGGKVIAYATFVAPDDEVNGTYYYQSRPTPTSSFSTSPEGVAAQEKIWQEVRSVLESQAPGALKSISV